MNVISLEFKKCCQCGARATRKIELVEVDEQGVTGATLVKHFCGDHGEPLDRDQLALLVDARDTEIERLTAENDRFRGCLEFVARPVVDRGGIVDSSEALIRAAAARDVLNLKAKP